MPNHCESDLYIYGPAEERMRLARHVAGLPPLPEPKPVAVGTDEDELLTSFRIADNTKDQIPIDPPGLDSTEVLFDCNTIIPYPEEYRVLDEAASEWDEKARNGEKLNWSDRPKDGFNQGGYEWCCSNWGTKWGVYQVRRELRKTSLFYSFQSAWSPPEPVIRKLATMFPKLKLKLKFFEMGAAYQGVLVLQGEEELEYWTKDYHGSRGG